MNIVLNEYDWAENMIKNHDLGENAYKTLSIISRYYYENKYNKKDIRRMLETFLIQCNPNVSLANWSDSLDKIARRVDKRPIVRLDHIDIYKEELDLIESINGIQLKRLAFTLLCVSKYWDLVSDKNNHWVNTPDLEIFKMANINVSLKRQSYMFRTLRDLEYIKFSKKIDNLNTMVLFSKPKGEVAMRITDFRNIGYQYMKYYGGAFFECTVCGVTYKLPAQEKGGRIPKYCKECAEEVKIQQSINSVMKRRGVNYFG